MDTHTDNERTERNDGPIAILEGAIAAGFIVPILVFDLRERRIPDLLTLPAIGALLAFRLLTGRFALGDLAAGAAGFGVFALLGLASGGRLGLGDAKLSAFLGLLLGFWGWLAAVFLASLTGTLFVLGRAAAGGTSARESVPFAPFLALGAAAAWLLRDVSARWLAAWI